MTARPDCLYIESDERRDAAREFRDDALDDARDEAQDEKQRRAARAFERAFRCLAITDTSAAADTAGYWLRDADAAMPDPHFCARLIRAVLTLPQTEAFRVASEWVTAAAIAYADNEEAKANESPMDCVRSLRRAR